MSDALKRILTEFNQLKGQFVITDSWTIERLIAIGADNLDYYYITYNGKKNTWHTCVGSVIQLKNKIDDNRYESFIRSAKMNHWDQIEGSKNFGIDPEKHKSGLINHIDKHDKYLTDICWELK